ncbi:MAG: hypothetical protein JWQ68_1636 [Cryobacterium sp.]|jgi:hypothetical protein|nr:hypothetical protein [Cryobacterium sp.]
MEETPAKITVTLMPTNEPPIVVVVAPDVNGDAPAVLVDPVDRLGRAFLGTWLSDDNGSPGRKTRYRLVTDSSAPVSNN